MSEGKIASRIPQPRPLPLVGNVPDIDRDAPIQSLVRLAQQYGPLFRLELPGQTALLVGSAALAAEACDETRFEKHIHSSLKQVRDFAGDGLFTAYQHEPNWDKAHRILLPAFGPGAMRSYFDDMLDIAGQMFTKWERLGPDENLDVADNMTRLTLDTIALCGLGYRFNSFYQREPHPFVGAMVRALAEAGHRTRRLPVQTRLMLQTQRQYATDGAYMHKLCDELILRRKNAGAADGARDLLGLMLTAKDPLTGETLDGVNIRYQLVTFLIAGHETTSGLLSFATHLLLAHPQVLQRARAAVDRVLGDQTPAFEHLAQLGYLDQLLRETLRLYPTAPAFGVHAKHDTTLGGHAIKKDQVVMVLIPAVHRDAAVWPDPERFDPERFSPAARGRIPDKAWLPFGNGQRACIGRAFAMQEATLVLAMLLQRFDFVRPEPYTLCIKETLTLKPAGLFIRARVRQPVKRSAVPPVAAAVSAPAAEPTALAARHVAGVPLLALYGSNSGSSEGFARRIASDGAARGFTVRVAALDEWGGTLPREGVVAIVTSSYNGLPPDNAREFVAWASALPAGALTGVRYAVFGCGSREWSTTYQAIPMLIDQRLREAGALDVVARGEADAARDFFGDFELWYGNFWASLATALGVAATAGSAGPLYEVQQVTAPGVELVRQNKLALAQVVENRELVDLSAPGARSKRHLELTLPAGMTYEPGDYLTVLPENHPELVARAVARMGLALDATLVLRSTRGAGAASLPTDRPVAIQELLGRHVELSTPATRRDLAVLAQHNACPPHRDHLEALARDQARYTAEILDKRVSVLDLLQTYASIQLPLAVLLELLPPMRVRQYSISSSPRWNPAACTLTVAVVDAPALSGIGRHHGTCSTYLARLVPGDRVAVLVRKPNTPFRPPADSATPIIMACAGTGVAPFRGFLQDRAAAKAAGQATGPALLFFGCDDPAVDFLYARELIAWERDGIVEVLPAFTHQPIDDVQFVQHRIWKDRQRVRELFRQGATVYVCGDGRQMAPAVRATLMKIYQDTTQCSDDEMQRWAEDVERRGRYVADVFT